ncbi:uncharacterized protein LY89DRAFT_202690 [Mollisia scopiformis]|uniref:Uncharacterized protein n=1 Tax=Mollisia scopiformis TaxID=149040 RepID=A0A194WXB3_MOLSC|nr:uncharacterized protein LY89DRAFT_202690 [Mollisia scopiformis]KUJ12232.1 hypothetical protein LY89DRAFT_202690 [Mollisia scopiformis]
MPWQWQTIWVKLPRYHLLSARFMLSLQLRYLLLPLQWICPHLFDASLCRNAQTSSNGSAHNSPNSVATKY